MKVANCKFWLIQFTGHADFTIATPQCSDLDLELGSDFALVDVGGEDVGKEGGKEVGEEVAKVVGEEAVSKMAEKATCGGGEGPKKSTGGEVKKRPIKQANLNMNTELYAKSKQSGNTLKSTRYAVKTFNDTMRAVSEADGSEFCELKDIPISEMPVKLARFLMLVTQQSGAPMNSSSLNTVFASLARYMLEDYEPKTDIMIDVNFKIARNNLKAAQKESASLGATSGKHRSEAFKEHHVAKLWVEGKLGRHAPTALVTTVQFIMIHSLGFRAVLEVYNVKNEDIVLGKVTKSGVPEEITVSERVTKTRQGGRGDVRDMVPKIFPDDKNLAICPVRNFLEYMRRKPLEQREPEQPFMLTIKQSALEAPGQHEYWYTQGRMGMHKIGQLVPNAFAEVGIDVKAERYTTTSARKTMIQAGVESGVPGVVMSKIAGHANLNSIGAYVHGKHKSHNAAGLILSRTMGGIKGGTFGEVLKGLDEEREAGKEAGKEQGRSRRDEPDGEDNASEYRRQNSVARVREEEDRATRVRVEQDRVVRDREERDRVARYMKEKQDREARYREEYRVAKYREKQDREERDREYRMARYSEEQDREARYRKEQDREARYRKEQGRVARFREEKGREEYRVARYREEQDRKEQEWKKQDREEQDMVARYRERYMVARYRKEEQVRVARYGEEQGREGREEYRVARYRKEELDQSMRSIVCGGFLFEDSDDEYGVTISQSREEESFCNGRGVRRREEVVRKFVKHPSNRHPAHKPRRRATEPRHPDDR